VFLTPPRSNLVQQRERLRRQLLAPVALWLGLGTWPAQAQTGPTLQASVRPSLAEVRGTWLTTTANDALASPEQTARSMRRLREIGLNTVYIEAWKNGYTQFPSQVLQRAIGHDRRPPGGALDPSDSAAQRRAPARDLLLEATTEAHRNGLIAIAWFEYGFMAAHKDTMNHLRRLKPEWLSRDRAGSEVAPNGFVWMNPLHPEARAFLLDLVLEAVDRYDLDGVQIDDRIVWPHVSMGYDAYTRGVYAQEHRGASPPDDFKDPAWMRWRAAKVDDYARWFVQELHARRPGLVVSLSPAVYPWSWDNYLLDWPRWTAWTAADRLGGAPVRGAVAQAVVPKWDETIPQAYRFDYPAFEKTWLQQTEAVKAAGAYRPKRLVPGIRVVGEGADSSWAQLRDSIALPRSLGQGGHVLWFSVGVLDRYPAELQALYAAQGPAHSPRFPAGWRPAPLVLARPTEGGHWHADAVRAGRWRVIGRDTDGWRALGTLDQAADGPVRLTLPASLQTVELLLDRRPDMATEPACRVEDRC
jgi:uncharacterized lipoprotein YddW (UPF0748 family)